MTAPTAVTHRPIELLTDPLETFQRLRDPYQPVNDEARTKAWNENQAKLPLAKEGTLRRVEFRGRSINSAEISHTFLGAVNLSFVAIVLTFGVSVESILALISSLPALFGFIFLLIGLLASWTEIDPRLTGDEFTEDLARNERDWHEETVNRMMRLRKKLRRLRLSQSVHILLLIMGVLIFILAIIVKVATLL